MPEISSNCYWPALAWVLEQAGGSPAAHAMISDYFPPEKRSTALSIYSIGLYIGILIAFLMGGYLNQHFGWRTAFLVMGVPGIIFSLLFYFTVKEPKKGATDVRESTSGKTYSLKTALKLLFSNQIFLYLAIAIALHIFCIFALLNWAPSFLSRLHGMKNMRHRCFTWFDLWYQRGNRNLCSQITDRSSWKKR